MDLSQITHPYPDPEDARHRMARLAEGMRANITDEHAAALLDRLNDAEQMWRYFCRRDEMNAEVHLEGQAANVRYTPISIAAERVASFLAALYYGRDVDYLTTEVESGGAPIAVRSRYHHHPRT